MKTLLITGCSSGIGQHCARGMAERGWRVFASARRPEDVERLRAEGFEALQLDLNDSASIRAAVEELLQITGGRLDALFNNGGYGQVGAVEDLTRDALRAQFETNLFGWVELTNLLIPVMRRQGHGRIVMNSSVLGYAAFAYRGAYNAVKFALEGITDTLRHELAGTGIQVVLIEPGPIFSRFRSNCLAPFERYIDWRHSIHRERYEAQLDRLRKDGAAVPFTLGPQAVLDKLILALEREPASPRYPVTVPAVAFWWLKRLLPIRAMDWVLLKASGGGKR